MLLFLYSLAYTLAFLAYLPVYLWRMRFAGRGGIDLLQRLGRFPSFAADSQPLNRPLWIHAVSVGEVNAMKPLIEELDLPCERLLISTTTNTGQEQARRLFRERARTFYFPLDWGWTCRRFLRRFRPAAVVLAETELWPGFLNAARRLDVPVLLVNGRISDRSFGRYRRLRFLLAPALASMERICMQSREDKKRILGLGAQPERTHWTGNFKYDYSPASDAQTERLAQSIAGLLKPHEGDRLWLCGSTREGEEEQLLDCLLGLRERFPELRMLIAPRHPHRAAETASAARDRGLDFLLRSQFDSGPSASPPDVLILDSIGELARLYSIADIVFIGGSLVPKGGQNVIEAAYFSKPILFGPHMENFREVAQAFVEAYAALQVSSAEELQDRVDHLLTDPTSAQWLGRNARKVIRSNQGAVQRTAAFLRPLLEREEPAPKAEGAR